jgi:protein-tyrosine-phosphatase
MGVRDQLEALTRSSLPDKSAYEVFFNKQNTYALAAQLGIRVPRQVLGSTPADAEEAVQAFGFPLVIKPLASVTADNPQHRRTVIKVRDRTSLNDVMSGPGSQGIKQLQESIEGIGVGVEVLAYEGCVLTAFQHERVHEPLDGGGSSYRRSVPLSPELLAATTKLIQAVNYTGVAMAEFKVNRTSGTWALIEVNARFWGSLPLTIHAGLDFPRFLYEMLCLGKRDFPRNYKVGVYARNWLADLYWQKANWEADRRDPDLLTLPIPAVLAEFRHLLLGRESSDTFHWTDPAPAVHEIVQFARMRLSPAVQRNRLVRRRLQRRALQSLRSARRTLFLCYGNICRSPFAEHVWASLAKGRQHVSSAGHFPVAGREAPSDSVSAARRFHVHLDEHRSLFAHRHEIEQADCILIFDRKNLAFLQEWHPEALSKTHYLGALGLSGDLEIPDPFGHPEEMCVRTYQRIVTLLETTARDLGFQIQNRPDTADPAS